MSDALLRSRLIRLAHAHPELRGDLLPMLVSEKTAARKEANANSLDDILTQVKFRWTGLVAKEMARLVKGTVKAEKVDVGFWEVHWYSPEIGEDTALWELYIGPAGYNEYALNVGDAPDELSDMPGDGFNVYDKTPAQLAQVVVAKAQEVLRAYALTQK